MTYYKKLYLSTIDRLLKKEKKLTRPNDIGRVSFVLLSGGRLLRAVCVLAGGLPSGCKCGADKVENRALC